MKLNHLNLTVNDVPATRQFLEKYFGLRAMEQGPNSENFDLLRDDHGMILTLMKVSNGVELNYPASFHIGFVQDSEEKVDQINQRLKNDGYEVKPPRRFHGSWTFYLKAPGGFLIEVLC